jgi:cob(I)alamin adenosyltransferase
MDLEKIIDALVESTKQTISKEMEKVKAELQQDQRRTIISLAKSTIRRDVDAAMEPLETRLKEMVQSFAPKDGKDGESVNPEQVKELVSSWLAENIKQPEAAKNGVDGVDGRDALQVDI